MTLRPPSYADIAKLVSGADRLDAEIASEMAATLGRAGVAVEKAIAALEAATSDEDRLDLAYAAAEAVQALLIQRELMGVRDSSELIQQYRIPRTVLAKIGARR